MISAIFTIFLISFQCVRAHSFLAEPASARRTGFGETCQPQWSDTPCCASKAEARPSATTYQRGQQVEFKWPRNNHAGGFIRLAIVPFDQSDSVEEFNKSVFHYNCHESKCDGHIKDDPYSPDNMGDHENLCSSTFTVPTWIPDGQYTIQWTWSNGGIWYKNRNKGQTSYQTCMDFTVNGGEKVTSKPQALCPVFLGGDSHFPDQNQCRYFISKGVSTVGIRTCDDGCDGTWTSGIPAQVEECAAPNNQYTGEIAPAQHNKTTSKEILKAQGVYKKKKCKKIY